MARRKTKPQVRKNNKGSLLIFFSAIIIAGALVLTRQPQEVVNATEVITPVVGQFDTVRIPVPKAPIRAGEKIRDASFSYVSYPTHQLPPNTIRDIGPYLDAVAVAPLPANLPLFEKNISLSGGASNPVIERIPEGMRAISVRVDATAAVEGWARAGAIVDVFLVKKAGASVVAEKVKILSAERSVQEGVNEKAEVPSTVTLLVSQDQALAISTASNNGKIQFALRSLTDEGSWQDPHYDADRLSKNPAGNQKKTTVSGFIKLGDGKAYALTDGKWTASEVKPQGFLVGEK